MFDLSTLFSAAKAEGRAVPVILDGDPGHDDAIGWMLAKASPLLDIRAVTSCAGNQTLEKTTYNARRICTLLGIDAPIARGLPPPRLADPSPVKTSTVNPVWTVPSCRNRRGSFLPSPPWS